MRPASLDWQRKPAASLRVPRPVLAWSSAWSHPGVARGRTPRRYDGDRRVATPRWKVVAISRRSCSGVDVDQFDELVCKCPAARGNEPLATVHGSGDVVERLEVVVE